MQWEGAWQGSVRPFAALLRLLLLLLLMDDEDNDEEKRNQGLRAAGRGETGTTDHFAWPSSRRSQSWVGLTAAAPPELLEVELQGVCAPPFNARPGTYYLWCRQ